MPWSAWGWSWWHRQQYLQDQNRIIQTLWVFDDFWWTTNIMYIYIIILLSCIYYLLLRSSFKRLEGSQYKKVTQLPQPAWPTRSSVIFDGRYPTDSCGKAKTVIEVMKLCTEAVHSPNSNEWSWCLPLKFWGWTFNRSKIDDRRGRGQSLIQCRLLCTSGS